MSYRSLIDTYLEELKTHAQKPDMIQPSVSKAGIYRHIDHVLRSTHMMLTGLEKNDTPKPKFNPVFKILMWLERLPRGVAKSPVGTYTNDPIDQQGLQEQFDSVESDLNSISEDDDLRLTHPEFGDINTKKTFKFIAMHLHHHLKIIRDIKKNKE